MPLILPVLNNNERTKGHTITGSVPPAPPMILGPKFSSDTVMEFPCKVLQVIEIDSESSVTAACRVLIKQNVQSAPVYDSAEQKYLGFFDIQDAVALATNLEDIIEYKDTGLLGMTVKQMFAKQAETRENKPASYVSRTSKTLWLPVTPDTPMRIVVNMLATKVRRVPVVDPKTNRVCKVVSQSLVCNEIAETLKTLPEMPVRFTQTPKDFGIAQKKVLCVKENVLARDAFNLLRESDLTAVGVVDEEEGEILTCLTAKDIRLLFLEEIDLLDMNVMDFIGKGRALFEAKTGKTRAAIVVCNMNTPVFQMLARLQKTNMHRLFLVDEHKQPCGVFSVGDAVRLIAED